MKEFNTGNIGITYCLDNKVDVFFINDEKVAYYDIDYDSGILFIKMLSDRYGEEEVIALVTSIHSLDIVAVGFLNI